MRRSSVGRPGRRGFTLVEMLVVLGILVLLASLVVPRFLGSQRQADIKAAQIQIAKYKEALELYAADTKSFPSTDQGLEALLIRPADLEEGVPWNGPYLSGELAKDPWGNEYQYECVASTDGGEEPRIWSFGPDKEDNTDDDICSWKKTQGPSGSEEELAGEDRGTERVRDVRSTRRREIPRETRRETRLVPRKEPASKTTVSSRPPVQPEKE